MATVADVATLRRRLGMTSNASAADDVTLAEVLAAAALFVDERVYAADVDADDVVEAKLLLAGRLYRRRMTPEGVAGFGGDGAVVRVLSRDPDVAELLGRHLDTARQGVG